MINNEIQQKVNEGKVLSEIPLLKEEYMRLFHRKKFKEYAEDYARKSLDEGYLTSTIATTLADYIVLSCSNCGSEDITALFNVYRYPEDKKNKVKIPSRVKMEHVGDLCDKCNIVSFERI